MKTACPVCAAAGEGRQALLDEILPVLVDTGIEDEMVGGLLRNTIGMERLRAAVAQAAGRLPRDKGHLAMLDNSYSNLPQFTPYVLKAIEFTGGTGSEALMEAVTILKKLNADGARKVPEGAPADFVPAKWADYLEQASRDRDVTAYRHFWELTVRHRPDASRRLPGRRRTPRAHLPGPQREREHLRYDQRRGRHRTRQARPGRLPAPAAPPPRPELNRRTRDGRRP
ncbi:hypothetical protein [Streptomyces lydicus]|uniref:hypothetical protein n=1 Tax=Streptomyces lydicus TaxID=47763 RepID=UPI0013E8F9E1|nr:hypothetical protein [Streptomyces lydicus]